MKCPKCNYISFDFNRTCPKCGNDNTEEQARLNLSPNKPNPPFFLAALIGVQDSPNYEISANENDIAFPGTPHEEFDAQELLIALDDLQTDNPKTDSLEPPDSGEDEILFELDPTPEDEESESGIGDPLTRKACGTPMLWTKTQAPLILILTTSRRKNKMFSWKKFPSQPMKRVFSWQRTHQPPRCR